MANEQVRIDLIAEDKASAKIDDVAEAVDELERSEPEITVTADDKASPDLEAVVEIIDELQRATPEVTVTADDKASPDLAEIGDKAAQLSRTDVEIVLRGKADALRGELAAVNAELKSLEGNATAAGAGVDEGARKAKGGTDELSDSARGANSALANMVGNTAQDLGALGGLAGSAGVAIGQMAEYAGDATLAGESLGGSLLNMAKVAGPIAALTIGVELLNRVLHAGEADDKARAESTRDYAEALLEAADAGDDLGASLDRVAQKKVDKILTDAGTNTAELVGNLEDLGLTYDDVVRAFRSGDGPLVDALGRYREIDAATRDTQATMGDTFAIEQYGREHGKSGEAMLAEWEALKQLNAELGAEAELSQAGIANAAILVGWREADTQAVIDNTAARAAGRAEQERYVALLEQRAGEVDEQRRLNEQNEIARDRLAAINTELDHGVDKLDAMRAAYKRMSEEMSERRTLLTLKNQMDDLKDSAIDAFGAAASGAEDAESKARDYEIAQIDMKQNVIDYVDELGNVPEQKTTAILALIDQGQYDAAQAALDRLDQDRTTTVHVNTELNIPDWLRRIFERGGDPLLRVGPSSAPPPSSPSVSPYIGTVNMTLPAGWRGDPLRSAAGVRRRAGRNYARVG